jgi:hypothetical protein
MRGEVALLTRNVLIDAEDAVDSTTYGGHIKVNREYNIWWTYTGKQIVQHTP